jgi:amino acid transporter
MLAPQVPDTRPPAIGLVRALGALDCVLYVAGSMIGTGVFLSVGQVARKAAHPAWVLLAWVLGGIHALTGGFTYAELGARRPDAGGAYVYLSETFGPLLAFLYDWAFAFIVQPASVAALSVGFAEYLGAFFPDLGTAAPAFAVFGRGVSRGQLVAVAMALLLSIWNCLGIREGGKLNDVLTVVKIGSILILVGAGLASPLTHAPSFSNPPVSAGLLASFGGALAGVIWSYDGWTNVSALGSEVKRPERDLPIGLVAGISAVMLLYLSVNFVYLMALDLPALGATPRAAETVVRTLFGGGAARWITAAVLVSVLGSLSANVIPGPRVTYATARDGLLPRAFARLHPKHATPAFGLMLQGLWGSALVLSGTFDQLVSMIAFAGTVFYALGGAALFVYRRERPEAPYRCPAYPWTPAVYVGVSILFSIAILVDAPLEAGKGALILALGGVVFLRLRRSA